MEIPYILIAFLFPIAAACMYKFIYCRPIFFNAYEFDTYSCWFKSDYIPIGFWLRMIFFFIPLWVLFIINMTLTGLTYKELKRL